MADRSPEDILAGVLQISVGGIVKAVPTLPIKYIAEWAKLLDALTPTAPAADPREGFTLIARVTTDGLLDLVTAYDRTGALGGREWLEGHADPQQLQAAAAQMADNAFPLGDGASVVGQMLATMLAQAAPKAEAPQPGPSGLPSSMSGASRNGASRRRRSARSSIPSS